MSSPQFDAVWELYVLFYCYLRINLNTLLMGRIIILPWGGEQNVEARSYILLKGIMLSIRKNSKRKSEDGQYLVEIITFRNGKDLQDGLNRFGYWATKKKMIPVLQTMLDVFRDEIDDTMREVIMEVLKRKLKEK